jgi:excinuclease UvrABC nuclease subunit
MGLEPSGGKMQLKGPFTLTPENVYFVPSKPGAYLLGDQAGRVVYVGRADGNLAQRLKSHMGAAKNGATQFWYADTWSSREACDLEESLSRKYLPPGRAVSR